MTLPLAVPEQQLTVYTAQTSYSLPVLDRQGKPYIALLDLLSPLGAANPRNKGKDWTFSLNKAEARLSEGKDKANINGNQVALGEKVLVENNRVLVPMESALPFLSRMLNIAVDFHQPARRIFVGNSFTRFSPAFKNGDKPSLALNFSQPVTPDRNHQEERGGLFTVTDRTTLLFRKDPLVADTAKLQFGDGAIQSLTYAEENGTASLTVTGNTRLQIVRSDDGKTITLEPALPLAASTQTAPPDVSTTAENQHRAQDFFVMIDPSHGGYDKGANMGGQGVEKDITLRLARELRTALEERGIASRMLRDSDVDVALNRRAEITNEQHASLYVALHAGPPGKGVRVYSLLPADPQPAAGLFLPWESAQSTALGQSKSVAQAVALEMKKRGLTAVNLNMPVRPLNNVISPAIAVEITPEIGNTQVLEAGKRENTVASAIAMAVAQVRDQLEPRP